MLNAMFNIREKTVTNKSEQDISILSMFIGRARTPTNTSTSLSRRKHGFESRRARQCFRGVSVGGEERAQRMSNMWDDESHSGFYTAAAVCSRGPHGCRRRRHACAQVSKFCSECGATIVFGLSNLQGQHPRPLRSAWIDCGRVITPIRPSSASRADSSFLGPSKNLKPLRGSPTLSMR
jgi:hypothetical protein